MLCLPLSISFSPFPPSYLSLHVSLLPTSLPLSLISSLARSCAGFLLSYEDERLDQLQAQAAMLCQLDRAAASGEASGSTAETKEATGATGGEGDQGGE